MKLSPTDCGAALLAALLSTGAAAADDGSWQHTLALYGIGASMDGETTVKGVTADVDVGFDDILDNLEFAGMVAYRAERGPWAIGLDYNYMKLEVKKDGLGRLGRTRATVDSDQKIVQLDVGHAITGRLSGYGGLRYTDLGADLQVVGGGPLGETLAASGDDDWVDPVIGLRYLWPLGASWEIVAKGDIGGFGIASDFTWQTTLAAGWNATDHLSLLIGLRYIGVDYEDGAGANYIKWDVVEGGPAAAVAWRF